MEKTTSLHCALHDAYTLFSPSHGIRNYLLRLNFTSAPRNNKQLFETVEIDSLFFIYPYIDIEISGVVILAFNQ